ncbi:hypothetical protein ABZ468_48315 [Streptomyces sp. NPDC005708]|uniref:hypothetical protein n=1 Tax=Streptomyces sp. NPDC005708 TaxID=3154564 RepID=UPI0033E17F48
MLRFLAWSAAHHQAAAARLEREARAAHPARRAAVATWWAVARWFTACRSDEDYWLYADDIGRCVRTAPASYDFRFPDEEVCAVVNNAAVFHAQADPDDEGLPCVAIAGVLVFAYLDASMQAVRVSIHLDAADELVIQPGKRCRCT